MVVVSCSGKFHAFNLAEQLANRGILSQFYTRYAYQRNTWMRRLVSRIDKENIPVERISTIIPLAISARLKLTSEFTNSHLYDKWVSAQLRRYPDSYKVFIGWSGMSLHSIRQAKQDGKLTILERGSSHIRYQNTLLHEEYERFGKSFHIDQRTIDKECQEYDEADYISVPSQFVRKTFLDYGLSSKKLLLNPYGASQHFKVTQSNVSIQFEKKFTILYLGTLNIRKGLLYLFQAIRQLPINLSKYDVWFIGSIDKEIHQIIKKYKQENWKFWGHIDHYKLPQLLIQTDVGIQPSIEEGLSMVIPQMMMAGIPVVATENTGATDIITEGENGFIIPTHSPNLIAERIMQLYQSPAQLQYMKYEAATRQTDNSWDAYGKRYIDRIHQLAPITQAINP